jgi:hypothetical protein
VETIGVVSSCIGFGSGCGIKAPLGELPNADDGAPVVLGIVESFGLMAAGGGEVITAFEGTGERLDFIAAGGGDVIPTFEGDKVFDLIAAGGGWVCDAPG